MKWRRTSFSLSFSSAIIAAGKYAAMHARLNTGSIDLTIAIEERLRALKAGEALEKFHLSGGPGTSSPHS